MVHANSPKYLFRPAKIVACSQHWRNCCWVSKHAPRANNTCRVGTHRSFCNQHHWIRHWSQLRSGVWSTLSTCLFDSSRLVFFSTIQLSCLFHPPLSLTLWQEACCARYWLKSVWNMLSKSETDTNHSHPGYSTSMVSTMSGFVAATSSGMPTFAAALVLRISMNLEFAVDSLFSTQPSTFHIWSFWVRFRGRHVGTKAPYSRADSFVCVNFSLTPIREQPRDTDAGNSTAKISSQISKAEPRGRAVNSAQTQPRKMLRYAFKPSQEPVSEAASSYMSGSPFEDLA